MSDGDIKRLEKSELQRRAYEWMGGDLSHKSTQEVAEIMAVACYVHDLSINAGEKQGLVVDDKFLGVGIPYHAWPQDMEFVETILTR